MWRSGLKGSNSVPPDKRELFEGLFVEKAAIKVGGVVPNDHHTLALRTTDWKNNVSKERDYPIVRFNGKTWEEYRVIEGVGYWLPAREHPFENR